MIRLSGNLDLIAHHSRERQVQPNRCAKHGSAPGDQAAPGYEPANRPARARRASSEAATVVLNGARCSLVPAECALHALERERERKVHGGRQLLLQHPRRWARIQSHERSAVWERVTTRLAASAGSAPRYGQILKHTPARGADGQSRLIRCVVLNDLALYESRRADAEARS